MGERHMKVKCWEVFDCEVQTCPAFDDTTCRCWLVSGTCSRGAVQGSALSKIESCLECEVLNANMEPVVFKDTLRLLSTQFKEYDRIARDRELEMDETSMELALGLSENFEVLRKVSEGDLSARVSEDSSNELIAKLSVVVNETIQNLRKIWADLETSKSDLADKVEERTRDLSLMQKATINIMEDLEESKTYIENVVAGLLDSMIVTTTDGTIRSVNSIAVELLGYPEKKLIGQNFVDLLPVTSKTLFRLNETIKDREVEVVAQDGRRIPMILTASVMHDRDGAAMGMVIVAKDITDRKQAERALVDARNAAEAATRAKSDFLANMSHEIRTPMNGIIGMTELALETDLAPEQREFMETVKQSADHLLKLINDILDLSKIEAQKLDLDPIPFSLRGCLGKAIKPLAMSTHEKSLELVLHVSPEIPDNLIGDPGRVGQVVTNLVGNAIKFTDQGEVVVRVESDSIQEERICLHFSITDTGIGIPTDKLSLIFDHFSQADTSTTRQYGGTGLGLTISAHLARMMNGRIWAESEVGSGSSFHFTATFGLQKGAQKQIIPLALDELKDLPALVVDDNATNRKILEETLRFWGMVPILADRGKEAFSMLWRACMDGKPVALVLLDAMMPEMDGFEVAEMIRQNSEFEETRIVLLTSACYLDKATRWREIGIDACLTKPASQPDLLETILTVMGVEVPVEVPAPGSDQPGTENRRCLRILLAEDNPVNQKVATSLLKKHGHTVVVAGDGLEALEILEEGTFDLVLMDVQMPKMGGFEATREIRNRERSTGNRIPIMALTAHALKGYREKCLAAGMDDYLSKPIKSEELYSAIDRVRYGARTKSAE